MSEDNEHRSELDGELVINRDDFRLETLEDELRVDNLCLKILRRFYSHLLENGVIPEKATSLASSADYFVRDFVVGFRQSSIFDERPDIVRQFAGNWYIVNTLEPNIHQLSGHLEGVRAFYLFLQSRDLISDEHLQVIGKECAETDYYEKRIDSFWHLEGDGFFAWERECTLKDS